MKYSTVFIVAANYVCLATPLYFFSTQSPKLQKSECFDNRVARAMIFNFVLNRGLLQRFSFKNIAEKPKVFSKLFGSTANRNMSEKFKVLVTRRVPDEAMEILTTEKRLDIDLWDGEDPIPNSDLLTRVKGKHGLYCLISDKINEELLNSAGDQLKVVSTMSVGYDHIDTEAIKSRGILLGNTPDVLTDATADLTVGLVLATCRRLIEAADCVKSGEWGSWRPLWMCGTGLKGSTVGIVGMGRIGQAVCQRLAPFGPSVFLYCGHQERRGEENPVNAEFVGVDELVSRADFVIVSCSLTPSTKGMFNKELFSKMKPTSIFVNVSRGAIVNQEDLHDALTSGKIKAAGLDVTTPEPLPCDHKLLKLKNCVILPHIGSADVATRTGMAVLAARNLVSGLLGRKMPAQVPL